MDPTPQSHVTCLAFSGGGTKGLAYIGALKALEEYGINAKQLRQISGTSIGAFFGLLVLLQYTSTELESLFLELDMNRFRDISVMNLVDNFGLDSGKKLEKLIQLLLRNKGFADGVTFKQLHDIIPVKFHCTVTNLNEMCPLILSNDTYPDLKVCSAVKMSMAIPLLFCHSTLMMPGSTSEITVVDGGLTSNFPIDIFSSEPKESVFGFYLGNSKAAPLTEPFEMDTFIAQNLACLSRRLEVTEIKRHIDSGYNFVQIDTKVSSTNFHLSRQEKVQLIADGYNSTQTHLNRLT